MCLHIRICTYGCPYNYVHIYTYGCPYNYVSAGPKLEASTTKTRGPPQTWRHHQPGTKGIVIEVIVNDIYVCMYVCIRSCLLYHAGFVGVIPLSSDMAPATTFSPPETLHFNVGSTESTAVAVAAKLAKKVKKQRLPIKRSFWKSIRGQAAKAATRKSMLNRSSLLRQGKFAEARSRNPDGELSNETRD